jgi:hypothetical protein
MKSRKSLNFQRAIFGALIAFVMYVTTGCDRCHNQLVSGIDGEPI